MTATLDAKTLAHDERADLDWSTGTGPVVEGPAEALLMAIAGRCAVVPELSGPGRVILEERSEG